MKDELIGWEVLKSKILKCKNCNEPLVEVVLTETNENRTSRGLKPQFTKVDAVCYKCGTKSFQTELLSGSVISGSLKNSVEIDDTETDMGDNGEILTTIKLKVK